MPSCAETMQSRADRLDNCVKLLGLLRRDRWLNGHSDASDVIQHTMLKAVQHIDHFRGRTDAQLVVWLRRILRNELVDRATRAKKPRGHVSIDQSSQNLKDYLIADLSSPSSGAVRRETTSELDRALQTLPDDQRIAVQLRHLDGCTVAEICKRMDKTPAAVAGLLRRGLNALREALRASLP